MAYSTISRILTITSTTNRSTAINDIHQLKMNSYSQTLIKRLIYKFDNNNENKEQNTTKGTGNDTHLTYTTHIISECLQKLLVKHDEVLKI